LPHADALYNSSEVVHDSRWTLTLPDFEHTQRYLSDVLTRSLAQLRAAPDASDEALYFWRLAMQHEAMHNEASVYMAQNLGVALPEAWCVGHAHAGPAQQGAHAVSSRALSLPAQVCTLGHAGPGFAFDNECPAHTVALAAFEIDAQPVCWARFSEFVEDGGYDEPRWWTESGWAWVQAQGRRAPRGVEQMRGAAMAIPGSSPKARMRMLTWAMAGWMYCEPAAPMTRRTAPRSRTSVGAMVELAYRFEPRVRASKLAAEELRKNPPV
jgi:formylglycine-generating enzyme required for sulfatase activity